MASQYTGVSRGVGYPGTLPTVVTGQSTTGKDMELVVDLSKSWTRADVLRGLEALKNFILSNTSPYAQ